MASDPIAFLPENTEGVSERQQGLIRRRLRYFNSQLDQFAALVTDPLYRMYFAATGESTQLTPISNSATPVLPFLITLVPPDVYPSNQTIRATIPTPSNASFDLVRVPSARLRPAVGVDQNSVRATSTVDVPVEAERVPPASTRIRRLAFEQDAAAAQRVIEESFHLVEDRDEENDPYLVSSDEIRAGLDGRSDLAYLRQQAREIKDLPTLAMLIPPQSLTKNYNHVVASGTRTRLGFIVEYWGEQQPKLTISGKTGAFLTVNKKGGGGLVIEKRGSAAWQQFMALSQIYRSSALLRNLDGSAALAGAVEIYYDGVIYLGSFDSFNYSFDESTPFMVTYDMAFTVRYEQNVKGIRA
jgi:hypothetical protein